MRACQCVGGMRGSTEWDRGCWPATHPVTTTAIFSNSSIAISIAWEGGQRGGDGDQHTPLPSQSTRATPNPAPILPIIHPAGVRG